MRDWVRLSLIAAVGLVGGCASDAGTSPSSDAAAETPPKVRQPLGGPCSDDGDCVAGVCLRSAWGTPFCTRPCTSPGEACPGGDDVATGVARCVSFDALPNPSAPAFTGDLRTFCVPGCQDVATCKALNPDWETCDVARWLGAPLYPNLGNLKVCAAPSFQGKEPVDPARCDWEKTIAASDPNAANHANSCRSYCRYLDRCKLRQGSAPDACCEWGCFNRMKVEGKLNVAWQDEVKCFVSHHASYAGTQKECAQEPVDCGGAPADPTPAASGLP